MPVAHFAPVMTTKNDFKHCQISPGGAKLPPVENPEFRIKRDYSSWEAQREFSTAEVPFESVLTAE